MTTAFGPTGLLSHDHKMVYADPTRLAKVTAPALFLVGDRDRMCPPEGCKRTWQVRHALGLCFGPLCDVCDDRGQLKCSCLLVDFVLELLGFVCLLHNSSIGC